MVFVQGCLRNCPRDVAATWLVSCAIARTSVALLHADVPVFFSKRTTHPYDFVHMEQFYFEKCICFLKKVYLPITWVFYKVVEKYHLGKLSRLVSFGFGLVLGTC